MTAKRSALEFGMGVDGLDGTKVDTGGVAPAR